MSVTTSGESVQYTAHLEGVGPVANQWSETFLPDQLDVWWNVTATGEFVLEVGHLTGIGILRSGELGKRRRMLWFDAEDIGEKMPPEVHLLVLLNRPRPVR